MVLIKGAQFDDWNLVLALWVFEKYLTHPSSDYEDKKYVIVVGNPSHKIVVFLGRILW